MLHITLDLSDKSLDKSLDESLEQKNNIFLHSNEIEEIKREAQWILINLAFLQMKYRKINIQLEDCKKYIMGEK